MFHHQFGLVALFQVATMCVACGINGVAAEKKPVMIIATSAIEEVMGDFAYLAEAIGFAEYGQMGTMMVGQYLEGLDDSRPMGLILKTDGEGFQPLGMLPIKDLKRFLASLEQQIGEPDDAGNGILELAGPAPIYVKEQNGWAFIAQSVDDLEELPNNPLELLAGLNKSHDIAIRGMVQNIPQSYREMALEQIKEGVNMQLENLPEDEDANAKKEQIENSVRSIQAFFDGTNEITIGLNIDADEKKVVTETTMTAVPDTKISRQMDTLKSTKTRFAGFLPESAAITMNSNSIMLAEDKAATLQMLDSSGDQIDDLIDESDEIPNDDAKAAIKGFAQVMLDVFRDTLETGEFDLGGSLQFQDGNMVWVSGMKIASGDKLEAGLKEMASELRQADDAPKFEISVDQHAGVRFHRLTIPIPEDEDEAREMFGESLEIIIGVSKDRAYVAAGQGGMPVLRQSIDGSADQQAMPPFRMRIALTQIMKYAKSIDDNDMISAMTAALESAASDQIMAVAVPIDQGVSYKFQIDEGVLRAIGEGVRAAQNEMVME